MEGFAQIDEHHHLQIAEKDAIQAVREGEQDVVELLEQRAREEQCVVIMTPFSDIAQVKKESLTPEVSKVLLCSSFLQIYKQVIINKFDWTALNKCLHR
jgi:hypothetical protein